MTGKFIEQRRYEFIRLSGKKFLAKAVSAIDQRRSPHKEPRHLDNNNNHIIISVIDCRRRGRTDCSIVDCRAFPTLFEWEIFATPGSDRTELRVDISNAIISEKIRHSNPIRNRVDTKKP